MAFCLNLMVDRLETWGKEREGGGIYATRIKLETVPQKNKWWLQISRNNQIK